MSLWTQSLLVVVLIVLALAAFALLGVYLADRVVARRSARTATDPYTQAQLLADRIIAQQRAAGSLPGGERWW